MFCTFIPLEAIYLTKDGKVIDIVRMEPHGFSLTCPKYTPKERAAAVLEVNKGFAEKNNIKLGDVFRKIN